MIPAWGRYVRFLPRALASLLDQAGVSTCTVVTELRDHPAVRLAVAPLRDALPVGVVAISAPTIGTARNAGAGEGDAPWLLFLDADDWLMPGALATLTAHQARGDVAVCGRYLRVLAGTGAAAGAWPPWWAPHVLVSDPLGRAVLRRRNFVPAVGCLVSRAAFEHCGGFRTVLHEDWIMAASLLRAGPVRLLRTSVLNYRVASDSISRAQHRPSALAQTRKALFEILE